jgi:hypothetical protein
MATESAAQTPTPAPASAQTPKVPTYRIKSLTISLELAEKEYGNGNSGYASLTATIDDGNVERMPDVVDAGIEMFVAAWETVLAGKVATKVRGMKADEFQDEVAKIRGRMAKAKALLREARSAQGKPEPQPLPEP